MVLSAKNVHSQCNKYSSSINDLQVCIRDNVVVCLITGNFLMARPLLKRMLVHQRKPTHQHPTPTRLPDHEKLRHPSKRFPLQPGNVHSPAPWPTAPAGPSRATPPALRSLVAETQIDYTQEFIFGVHPDPLRPVRPGRLRHPVCPRLIRLRTHPFFQLHYPPRHLNIMSIFSRFRDIVNSNISSMLDQAEDPEKLVRLMIQEMEDTLIDLKASCAGAIAARKKVGRSLDELVGRVCPTGKRRPSWPSKKAARNLPAKPCSKSGAPTRAPAHSKRKRSSSTRSSTITRPTSPNWRKS